MSSIRSIRQRNKLPARHRAIRENTMLREIERHLPGRRLIFKSQSNGPVSLSVKGVKLGVLRESIEVECWGDAA